MGRPEASRRLRGGSVSSADPGRSAIGVAVICGLVPLLTIPACYLISANAGLVPWCFPPLDGCTSISRAARSGPANLVFKLAMLPTAALIAWFWWIAARRAGFVSQDHRRIGAMRALGLVGAAALALYTSFLGVGGEVYQDLRRHGVTVYFSFTALAMLLLATVPEKRQTALVTLCALMLLLGLASIPLQHLADDRKAALNALEWCYALLMTSGFLLVGLHWRRLPA